MEKKKTMKTNVYKYSVYGNLKPIMKKVFEWTRAYTNNLYREIEDSQLNDSMRYDLTGTYVVLNRYPKWYVQLVPIKNTEVLKISLWFDMIGECKCVKTFIFDRAQFGSFGRLGDDLVSYQRKVLAGKEDQYTKHIDRVFENYSAELNHMADKIRLNCIKRLNQARLEKKKIEFYHRVFDRCLDLLMRQPKKYSGLYLTQRDLNDLKLFGDFYKLTDEDVTNIAKRFLNKQA